MCSWAQVYQYESDSGCVCAHLLCVDFTPCDTRHIQAGNHGGMCYVIVCPCPCRSLCVCVTRLLHCLVHGCVILKMDLCVLDGNIGFGGGQACGVLLKEHDVCV